jgi:hypothetical protein
MNENDKYGYPKHNHATMCATATCTRCIGISDGMMPAEDGFYSGEGTPTFCRQYWDVVDQQESAGRLVVDANGMMDNREVLSITRSMMREVEVSENSLFFEFYVYTGNFVTGTAIPISVFNQLSRTSSLGLRSENRTFAEE